MLVVVVILVLIVYVNVVVVKKFVVGFWGLGCVVCCEVSYCWFWIFRFFGVFWMFLIGCFWFGVWSVYFEKIRVFKVGL
ncbi:hypothetical protein, partial [Klebsiella pneumoniae]|uniref:hypothetical protein n=1 Tax=Klebsiella pneumoniae TaxID=573 RepID=UPI001C52A52F